MHFFKSFAAIATVAFGASCAIAVPLGDTGSAPTPENSLSDALSNPLNPLYGSNFAPGTIVFPDTSDIPTPPLPTTSSQPGRPSTFDTPRARRADVDDFAKTLNVHTEKLSSLVDQLKSTASSDGTNTVVADPATMLIQIKATVSDVADFINAYCGISNKAVSATANGAGKGPLVFDIISAALGLIASIMGVLSNVTAQGPVPALSIPFKALVSVLETLVSVLPLFMAVV